MNTNQEIQALLGFPVSTVVNIDWMRFADIITAFISEPAAINQVYTSSIVIKSSSANDRGTIYSLLCNGTKPLDAVAYILGGKPNTVIIEPAVNKTEPEKQKYLKECKTDMFYYYMYVMLRGSALVEGQANPAGSSEVLPSFMTKILGLTDAPHEVAARLCSFPIHHIRLDWVKSVSTRNFSPMIRQRFLLGLPGYRTINAIMMYTPSPTCSIEAKQAYDWLASKVFNKRHWSIFPPTRSNVVIQHFSPMGKVLGSLMLQLYDVPTLEKMVELRILAVMPVDDVRYHKWRSWHTLGDIDLGEEMQF